MMTSLQDSFRGLSSNRLYVPFVVVAYGASSLSGVFVNKACLSGYNFGYPITLMLLQLIVSVTLTNILRYARVLEIPHKPLDELTFLLIPATLLISNVTVGLYALKLVNIPMFSAFRRLSSINVMVLEYYVLGKVESGRVIATVLFMIFGSFIAALGDVTFSLTGYVLVFVNNCITGGNLVYIKKAQQVTKLDSLPLFYYISLFALPLCFIFAVLSGELKTALEDFVARPELHTPGFFFALFLSALSAFAINYTTNLCTHVTSALTTAITGQTKNILQTVLGIFTWGYEVTVLNLVGLFLALTGSVVFGWVKFTEKKVVPEAKTVLDLETSQNSSKGEEVIVKTAGGATPRLSRNGMLTPVGSDAGEPEEEYQGEKKF